MKYFAIKVLKSDLPVPGKAVKEHKFQKINKSCSF